MLTILLLIASSFFRSPHQRLRASTLAELRRLSPRGFEEATASLLSDLGYSHARVMGGAGDLARDVSAIGPDSVPVTVQCKHYTKPVSSPNMQLFIGMLKTEYQGSRGIYATTSSYTAPARALGKRHGITLWDGNSLARLVVEARLRREASSLSSEQNNERLKATWQKQARELFVVMLVTAFLPSVNFSTIGSSSYEALEWFWGSYLVQPCCSSISFLDFGPVGKTETVVFVMALVISITFFLVPMNQNLSRIALIIFAFLSLLAVYEIFYPYQFPDFVYVPLEEFMVFVSSLLILRISRIFRQTI